MARQPPSATTPEVQADGASARPAVLLVVGGGTFSTHALTGDEVVIGRSGECHIQVDHPALSRRHAVLRPGPPPVIEDLGSTNGTRIAGVTHRGGFIELRSNDVFHIGPFAFALISAAGAKHATLSGRDPLRVIDPGVTEVPSLVRDVAASATNVLILGETGVGKEVLAATVHTLSGRTGPLTRINCAALAENLLESELFGHEKGAFTGAGAFKIGLLEAAIGGTVFLDEVGELPLAIQAKLLRAIEQREILRLGSVHPIAIDVRFVAATNRDLVAEVEAGRFRRDLYFRIDGVTLVVPPLRERRHLIAPLALEFLDGARKRGAAGRRLTAETLAELEAYAWPGNVRELRAVIDRAALLARSSEIEPRHLVFARNALSQRTPVRAAAEPGLDELDEDQRVERARIIAVLEACAGNQTRAAQQLGIPRTTLANRLTVLRIPRPRS